MSGQITDTFYHQNAEYVLLDRDPRICFDPTEYGLKPDGNCCSACWNGFWCDFAIIDNRLLLKNLYISAEDDHYPVIVGVSVQPSSEPPYFPVYQDLYLPIPWTGMLLVGDGFLKEYYAHLGRQRIWAYQVIKECVFKDGNLMEVNDLSKLGEQLRSLAPKRDPFGLWDYTKAEPMAQYADAWWL